VTTAKIKIVEAIAAPLGFFVLALLIVEAFLATVLIAAKFESAERMQGMWIGVGLFMFVTSIVSIFAWFKPQSLTFDKDAHLKTTAEYGTDSSTHVVPPDKLSPTQAPQS
jgi:hypothetical protein